MWFYDDSKLGVYCSALSVVIFCNMLLTDFM